MKKRRLHIAYTPDPDDAFHYFALQNGKISIPRDLELEFHHRHIQALNESCLSEEMDVCAISSVFYPQIDLHYVILGSGASVGRGYGPVLACGAGQHFDSLAGRRVAVPGKFTTGYFLLRYFYRYFSTVILPFDQIEDAILKGEVDAGVLIHEELLNYKERGLRKLCCLGELWYRQTGVPLPVGLNVAKRCLGTKIITVLENLVHASMAYALAHPNEAMAFASGFGRGPESAVRSEFVRKFANADTLLMPPDVRGGLSMLFLKALQHRLISHMPALDIVDPALA